MAVLCWAAKNSLRGTTVHSISLYEPILVKILNFIETVFHILNRNLPLGMEVLPPGSLDINPFDYLKCGVSRRGINRSFLKKTSLITTIMEVFSKSSWRPPRRPAATSFPG
jgi:hypothetical protein